MVFFFFFFREGFYKYLRNEIILETENYDQIYYFVKLNRNHYEVKFRGYLKIILTMFFFLST